MNGFRLACATFVTAFLCTTVVAPLPGSAAPHVFAIVNDGHHTVVEAHAQLTVARLLFGDKDWGENILGHAQLAPRVEMHFNAPQKASACKQDFKFVYNDGHIAIGKAMDICTLNRILLHY